MGGDAVTLKAAREFLVCLLGVQAADAYIKRRLRGPDTREEARARRFGDLNNGGL